MNIALQSQYNGHNMLIAVMENGRTVARFDDESEARQWASEQYNIDPDGLEWDR